MDKTSEARRIINQFAELHARTAFVAGHLGGQFGIDRIPLTALTITMIVKLCNLYGIEDNKAKAIHIASAIGRLTLRGTVIAQTMLNWIPIVGPGANSVVTYFLTKQAGWDCVNDIKKNRMNVQDQTEKAIRKGIVTVTGDSISEVSGVISSDVIEDVVASSNLLIETTEILSETLNAFTEILNNETLIEAEKVFMSSVISGVSKDIIENKTGGLKDRLWNGVMLGIAAGLYGDEIRHQEFELPAEDKARLRDMIAKREAHPGLFSTFIDQHIDAFVAASSQQEREKAVRELVRAVNQGIELAKAAKAEEEK